MDICKHLQIHQNTDTRMDMERTRISCLSNGADTNIILSAPIDIHLHPQRRLTRLRS
jgi:hypothetical protein